jgi:hypothetical protein
MLNDIPIDTDRIELPKKLEPIIKIIAGFDQSRIDAYLNYEIKNRFKLNGKELSGYYEIIKKIKKQHKAQTKSNNTDFEKKQVTIAIFDELVDLVKCKGNPAFLIKKEEKLLIVDEYEKDGVTYITPDLEQIPWMLPDGESILSLHESYRGRACEELDKGLYDELYNHHKEVSELPDDRYYDLITITTARFKNFKTFSYGQ